MKTNIPSIFAGITVVIVLSSMPLANADQTLTCRGINHSYAITAVLDNSDNRLKKEDIKKMTLTEPLKDEIVLSALAIDFVDGTGNSSTYTDAKYVQFAGYNHQAATRYDNYHIMLPISNWNANDQSIKVRGWFHDVKINVGYDYAFNCSSVLTF